MTTDIVERLRDYAVNGDRPTIWPRQIMARTIGEAADEIERLRAELGRIKCEECDVNYADPPSKLCPGCQAYREHRS